MCEIGLAVLYLPTYTYLLAWAAAVVMPPCWGKSAFENYAEVPTWYDGLRCSTRVASSAHCTAHRYIKLSIAYLSAYLAVRYAAGHTYSFIH